MRFDNILLILLFPLIFTACWRDEPEPELFHLTLGMEGQADVEMGLYSADLTINGYARWIEVGIIGNFDSYTISDEMPDWVSITELPHYPSHFKINVAALDVSESRTGAVSYTVTKGRKSQSGQVTITQNPLTQEDLMQTERRAIKNYLSKFDVVDALPAIDDIQVGSVAPFYKLPPEGSIYMQVVRRGSAPAATKGQTVYFRYLRYNLLSYMENGVLPPGEGNGNSLTQDVTSFELDSNSPSTLQWGKAIQIPLLIGLPADSEVNLVVTSSYGFTSDVTSAIPFLYNIRYLTDSH